MKPIIFGILVAVLLVYVVLIVPRQMDTPIAVTPLTPVASSPVKVAHDPGPNLICNGDFEMGVEPGKFTWLNPGNQAIDHWQVVDGQIDYVGTSWPAASGKRSIDLNGSPGRGGISQTFQTQCNVNYLVTFDMAGNPDGHAHGSDPIKYMQLEVISGHHLSGCIFSSDITGHDTSNINWSKRRFSFCATGKTTTLIFKSRCGPDPWGPLIDNVAVHRLP